MKINKTGVRLPAAGDLPYLFIAGSFVQPEKELKIFLCSDVVAREDVDPAYSLSRVYSADHQPTPRIFER